jgi:hypothetical protein
MAKRSADDARAWLAARPTLAELREAYPADWEAVERELEAVVDGGDPDALKRYTIAVSQRPSRQVRRTQGRDAALSAEIRRQMAAAALKQLYVSAATGKTTGRVRFNLLNGFVAQRLLFAGGLERKPVSLFWFRLLWPLLWQRRFLMPLVEPKGIYCFYSKRLVKELAAIIGNRSCLEIAAGDGTLSRFLSDAGVDVTPTDDHSWPAVRFPKTVLRMDAREALRAQQPEVVICSWPPAGNAFEQDVFSTASVELYVVIASRHRFASGNWDAYERQTGFTFAEQPELSRLVVPPELEAAVYVFRRKAPERQT